MTEPAQRRVRGDLDRRFTSLASGELACCVLFPLVFFGVAGLPLTAANVVGGSTLVILLLQGAAYWLVKRRSIRRALAARVWTAFRALRIINPVVLLGSGLVIAMQLTHPFQDWLLGLACWVLAVLEHVNYFHWQLSYDNRRDLAWLREHGIKRSALSRDLTRTWRTTGRGRLEQG
ncbi:hypothetical protein [Plantibacter sp. YIM 135347]|uniref:hypothetical protein n=1 Tax=Plantibacter sp. YIM 135347 TaxID=3423919 RepID=UPI003D3488F5